MRQSRIPVVLAFAVAGCLNISTSEISISYDFDPQQFQTPDFMPQMMGTVPDVPCTANPQVCSMFSNADAMGVCDSGLGKCVLRAEIRLPQTVDLSGKVPSQVSNSSVVNRVEVRQVRYWTPTNTLNFTTPDIALYIGPDGAKRETDAGVARLGTVPPLAAMTRTACGGGAAGTPEGACQVQLTESGKQVLGTAVKEYRTKFTVLVVAQVVARPGDPFPAGKLNVDVQPQVAFVIPLR